MSNWQQGFGNVKPLLLLALLAFVSRLPALRAPFLWDDELVIARENPPRSFRDIFRAFSRKPEWQGEKAIRPYRPLREAAIATMRLAFGDDPAAFHALSILLQVGNVLLLYALVSQAVGERHLALLSATFFAVHPIHTETVAWAKNLGEILAFALMALSMLMFVAREKLLQQPPKGGDAEARLGNPRSRAAPCIVAGLLYCGAVATFLLALGAKESAAPLPFLLLLWCALRPSSFHGERIQRAGTALSAIGRCAFAVMPFFIILALYALCQANAGVAGEMLPKQDLGVRFALATETMGRYVQLMAFPVQLCAWHYMVIPKASLSLSLSAWLFSGVALLALMGGLIWRKPIHLFGMLWTLIALGPVANLLAVNTGRPIAEQRLYAPSAGWCIFLAALFLPSYPKESERSNVSARLSHILLTLLLLVFLVGSWRALFPWQSPRALWRHVVRLSPRVAGAHANLGTLYSSAGLFQMALVQCERASEMTPTDAKIQNNLGMICMRLGEPRRAISHLRRAVSLQPDYVKAWANLGRALAKTGDFGGALSELDAAISVLPRAAELRNARGEILALQGQHESAIASFEQAILLDSRNVAAHLNLGNAFLAAGRYDDACAAHRRAVQLAPDSSEAQGRLGLALVYAGHHEDALRALERAVRLDPRNLDARASLARLHAVRKEFHLAGKEFEICLNSPEFHSLPTEEKRKLLLHAAHAFESAGREKEALNAWRDLLKIEPTHATAAEAVKRLEKRLPQPVQEPQR